MTFKYRNVKTEVDGIMFDSKREAAAYSQFRALEKCGAILKLERQVKFALWAGICGATIHPKWAKVADYIADFVVTEKDGTRRIYDAKGVRTPVYKLKKKIFEANYGERIVEI